MTAEQLRPDDLPMSDDAKRAMALALISDEIAYSPPFGGALHVWRWVKEQIVAASTAPTATSPRVETSGEPETATASPAQFEQAVGELILAVMQEGWQPSAAVIAARAALLSLFSKAAGEPKRAEGETVEGVVMETAPYTGGGFNVVPVPVSLSIGTRVRVTRIPE